MGDDRNQDGRFTQKHTDEDVIAAVRAHEPAATSEVASELGIARQSADYRLRRLRDDGRVNSKKIAASLVWFTGGGESSPDRREVTQTPPEQSHDVPESPPGEDGDGQNGAPAAASETLADLVDDVGDDTLPGSGAKLEARRDALRAVVAYLREHGTATPADLRRDVYPDHDGRYVDGKDPARSWWKNAMYPALADLAERSDDVGKADQTGEWAYTGEA